MSISQMLDADLAKVPSDAWDVVEDGQEVESLTADIGMVQGEGVANIAFAPHCCCNGIWC